MARFNFLATPLDGLMVVQRKLREDSRGWLSRLYCIDEFHSVGFTKPIVQMNHTLTRNSGSVRGMHYQLPPHCEAKVVSCLKGRVFDVAVDLRRNSPTFLKWHGEELSEENRRSLVIPEGFAHGFQTLADDCELLYLHTAAYVPDAEGALNPMDLRLAICWPLEVTELSDRDRSHPNLSADYAGIDL